MAFKPGLPELLILLVIILLLFGPGRISKMAGELGKGIRQFRDGLKTDEPEDKPADKPELHAADSAPDMPDKKV